MSWCVLPSLLCLTLATIYVASFYIRNKGSRNDPENVKRRFVRAFCMLFVSLIFPYFALNGRDYETASLSEWLGLKWTGLVPATLVPLCLTMVLFAGPLAVHVMDNSWRLLLRSRYWTSSLRDVLWLRNHVVAPVSEEFTFRACMLPLLCKCFTSGQATLICPIFFGVAHFHHMIEMYKTGMTLTRALLISTFQFTYTTLFGIYSAFLFLRTGHLIAPCLVHAFCNAMGFPDFGEIFRRGGIQSAVLAMSFIGGLVSWCFLLYPLTDPEIYGNTLYWN